MQFYTNSGFKIQHFAQRQFHSSVLNFGNCILSLEKQFCFTFVAFALLFLSSFSTEYFIRLCVFIKIGSIQFRDKLILKIFSQDVATEIVSALGQAFECAFEQQNDQQSTKVNRDDRSSASRTIEC